MAANAKAGRSTETLEALLLEKERLLRFGFTRTELDSAKGTLLSNMEMMAAEKDRRESEDFIEELASDFLEEQYAMDVEWEYDAVQQILPGIGLATVNSAIKACFSDDDITVIITSPAAESKGLPDEAVIINMINESRSAVIEKPEEKTAIPDLISDAVEPGSVRNITQGGAGTEIWELSNGMTLILASTANKNNELTYYALARGGIISAGAVNDESLLGGLGFSQEEAYFSAKLAAEIQGASGLGPLSRPELMNFLSDKQISISFWAGNNTRGVRGSSSIKDLSALFQLLYSIFTRPRIDQNGMSLVLDNQRTELLSEADIPEAFFFRELTRLIYSDHPLLAPLELADLDHVNEKAALAFLTLAMNPADYTLVFVGSLGNRDEFKKLVEMYLASIPNGDLPRWNAWLDPEIKRPEKTEKIIYKGKEEKCIVSMCWYVPKIWTEDDNGTVLVLNEYLDIILTDEIREKLGGVYSISAYTSLSPAPAGELSLEIFFICDPARSAELRKAVKDQLASLCLALDGETVKRAKEALVKNFEQSMENNGFLARNLANFQVITDTPLSHLPERPSLYRAVTEENIRLLMAQLLKGGPAELVLMPDSVDK
jgi:zinc protease